LSSNKDFAADTAVIRYIKKAVYRTLCETHRTATERHLPYGVTQCYLPQDTGERASP